MLGGSHSPLGRWLGSFPPLAGPRLRSDSTSPPRGGCLAAGGPLPCGSGPHQARPRCHVAGWAWLYLEAFAGFLAAFPVLPGRCGGKDGAARCAVGVAGALSPWSIRQKFRIRMERLTPKSGVAARVLFRPGYRTHCPQANFLHTERGRELFRVMRRAFWASATTVSCGPGPLARPAKAAAWKNHVSSLALEPSGSMCRRAAGATPRGALR
jgi:hypothetical protein